MVAGPASFSSLAGGTPLTPLSPSSFSLSIPMKGWVFGVVVGLAAVSIAALASPAVRKLLKDIAKWVKWFSVALVNYVFGSGQYAVRHKRCLPKGPLPLAASLPPLQDDFNKAKTDSDVTHIVPALIERFRPDVYQDPSDTPCVDMATLLAHSVVRDAASSAVKLTAPGLEAYHKLLYDDHPPYDDQHPYGEGPDEAWYFLDIDNDFAMQRGAGGESVVYARAIKKSPDHVELTYAFVRPGSYFPSNGDPYGTWEHEGDGEALTIIVERVGSEDWRVSRAHFSAHKHPIDCCGDCTSVTSDGRPKVYVAIGSHALAPTPDPRKDTFPSVDEFDAQHMLSYSIRHPSLLGEGRIEHEAVFTRRCALATPSWFAGDGPLLGAPYPKGYDEVAAKDGQEDATYAPESCGCEA